MKKIIVCAILPLTFLASCGEKKETKTETPATTNAPTAQARYACPMHCEGDKTYDAPGKCPMCKMDLKEVK